MERIDKILSVGAGMSRSDARRAIKKGRVSVKGNVIREIGFKVSENENIYLDSMKIDYKKYDYIIMNKPKGVLSASEDKNARTVIDILPDNLKRRGLFPVGRLDKDTTGLLIITDDGNFAHKVLAPDKKVYKTYIACLDREVTEDVLKDFVSGMTLADGTELAPAKIKIAGERTAEVSITEGKYHQIKRMFGKYHIAVVELKRISFAGLDLPVDLNEGEARRLNDIEIDSLIKKY